MAGEAVSDRTLLWESPALLLARERGELVGEISGDPILGFPEIRLDWRPAPKRKREPRVDAPAARARVGA